MFTPEKNIHTLVKDIYTVVSDGVNLTKEQAEEFGRRMSEMIVKRLSESTQDKETNLRMSNVGTKCNRKLWYTVNMPGAAERLTPNTKLKFLYGDMVEVLVLYLAEIAGHKVEGMGDTLELNEVQGHRDAVIDGLLVDVKSASGLGFSKFKYHKLEADDPFGYLPQLSSYLAASEDDPKVAIKGQAGFLAVDKEQGHLVLDIYNFKDNEAVKENIDKKKEAVKSKTPPPREYTDELDGANGNRRLKVNCSYCVFKNECWPNLRTFLYSTGPKYLTNVERLPQTPELVNGVVVKRDEF